MSKEICGSNNEAGLISTWEVCCCSLAASLKIESVIMTTGVFVGNLEDNKQAAGMPQIIV